MGTSQGGMGDGWTTFTYWGSGARFTAANAVSLSLQGKDGMYGIYEYFTTYAGYSDNPNNFYTQHIYVSSTSFPQGFTFAQYMAEIDAGRVVMI